MVKFDWRNQKERNRAQALRDAPHMDPEEPNKKRLRSGEPKDAGTTEDVEMADGGATLMASKASASSRNNMGEETNVDPVSYIQHKPYQYETVNAILPYQYIETSGITIAGSSTTSTAVGAVAFRLNSLFDIGTVTTYTADPTPAADTGDGSTQKAMFYDYWLALYRYYTVVSSHYRMTIWTATKSDDGEIAVWTYHNGQQQPPLVDSAGTPQVVKEVNRKLHPHCHRNVLKCRPASTTETNEFSNQIVIEGKYERGNYTVVNSVSEDEYSETWHKAAEIPSKREVVTFIFQRTDRTRASATAVVIKYQFDLWLTCQFKDQIVVLQYPTQTSDIQSFTDIYNILQG